MNAEYDTNKFDVCVTCLRVEYTPDTLRPYIWKILIVDNFISAILVRLYIYVERDPPLLYPCRRSADIIVLYGPFECCLIRISNKRSQTCVNLRLNNVFNMHLNERLSKQSRGWGFGTPSRPLWRHNNESLLFETNWNGVNDIHLFHPACTRQQ